MNILYVVAGGALGTLARYYTGVWMTNAFGTRTLSTFVVNIVGSFAIGAFLAVGERRDVWPSGLVLFVAVGILGGFTTFSAFTWQTFALAKSGDSSQAALNLAGSVVAGMLAVWAGASLARAMP